MATHTASRASAPVRSSKESAGPTRPAVTKRSTSVKATVRKHTAATQSTAPQSTVFLTKPPVEKRAVTSDDARRLVRNLQGIQAEIQDLVDRADRLLRKGAPHEYARASGYWLGQIRMALDGNSMCNMAESIEKIARDAGVLL